MNHPEEEVRQFVAWIYPLTWEYREEYCLYAGSTQAGPIYEVDDDNLNAPVIMGSYAEYRVDGAYETSFVYSHFDEANCSPWSVYCYNHDCFGIFIDS